MHKFCKRGKFLHEFCKKKGSFCKKRQPATSFPLFSCFFVDSLEKTLDFSKHGCAYGRCGFNIFWCKFSQRRYSFFVCCGWAAEAVPSLFQLHLDRKDFGSLGKIREWPTNELNKAYVKKKAVPLLFRSQGVCLVKRALFTKGAFASPLGRRLQADQACCCQYVRLTGSDHQKPAPGSTMRTTLRRHYRVFFARRLF